MATLLQDLGYGLRQLRLNPSFTVVAIVTLALGIGGNVAVFSLLDTVLLHRLPYSEPESLLRLYPTDPRGPMEASSFPDFEDWRRQSHTFEAMVGYHEDSINLTGAAAPERLRALFSTPGLFALLGVHPLIGREFSRDDSQHVALLTYELWQRQFAGDSGIVGKSNYLDGQACTVLGVLPPDFYFPPNRWGGAPEVFVPAVPNPDRGWNYLRVIGRLAPSVTVEQARTETKGIADRLAQAYPSTDRDRGIVLVPLDEVVSSMGKTELVLLGAMAFVLLIACVNVANLLLSRGVTREHEITVRTIMGATRSRLIRQLLAESLLMAGLGGALGVLVAQWALPLIAALTPEHTVYFTRVHDVGLHLDFAALAFSLLLTVLSAVLFGLLPAFRITRHLGRSLARFQVVRMRGVLVAFEVALCFMLLAGAGLMTKSLVRLLEEDIGFRTERLLTMDISLSGEKYSAPEKQAAFFARILQRLGSLPSVLSADAVTNLPMTRSDTLNGFEIPGSRPTKGLADYHEVSPDYFRTMGIPLLAGRGLLDSDSAHSPLVGVINRRLAQKYWPNQNPVGTAITVYRISSTLTAQGASVQFKPEQLEIVGVVGDVRFGLDAPALPALFIPFGQWPSNEMSVVIRTKAAPSSLIPILKSEIWGVDPSQPIADVKTMDELVS